MTRLDKWIKWEVNKSKKEKEDDTSQESTIVGIINITDSTTVNREVGNVLTAHINKTDVEEESIEKERIEIPDNLYILLSADYDPDKNKAFLKFYNIKKHTIEKWYDITDHHPYAYSKEDPDRLRVNPEIARRADKIIDLIPETKHDPITDRDIKVTKIVVKDPLVIGGTKESLREYLRLWEADIKYYANYIFDMKFQVGAYYIIDDFNDLPKPFEYTYPPEIMKYLNSIENESIKYWIKLLSMDVPKYKRLAVDIEVYNPPGLMPQAEDPVYPIFVISLRGSNNLKKVLILDIKKEISNGEIRLKLEKELGISIEVFNSEQELIERALEIMEKYPIIVTFNGDNFDLPYIRRRGERLGIQDITSKIKLGKNDARVSWGIHIDLYKFFKNVSIKTYAFSNAYDTVSLDSISKALIGKGKVELNKTFQEATTSEIIRYAYTDAELTFELTEFNNDLVMRLITLIGRIANMIIDDVCRLSISNWIKNRLVNIHREKNYLIPLPDEIRGKGGRKHLEPVTKGKKYVGAIVINPTPGIHFNVHVVDFASLYPSIMKEFNISYETVNCPHEECKDNRVPGTTTWICKKKKGIVSEFVGVIRDVRVMVFKKLAKDSNIPIERREFYEAAQGALKVFINASYGVIGADTFPFYYLPAAEAVTLLGRHAITTSIEYAKRRGLEVIYGDTDSLFIKDPDLNKLEDLIKAVERDLKLRLEVDKIYRYVVFSYRKKNYFGVLSDGRIDVKGLVGKKSSTPPFIKNVFYEILDILKNVKTLEEFNKARDKIKDIVIEAEEKIRRKEVPLEELAISVTISKPLSEYVKTTPQHVKAARKLERKLGVRIQPGTIIKIIKTNDRDGVAPLELVRSLSEVNSEKYVELLRTVLEQILDALNIDLDILETRKEYKSLDQFFTF